MLLVARCLLLLGVLGVGVVVAGCVLLAVDGMLPLACCRLHVAYRLVIAIDLRPR